MGVWRAALGLGVVVLSVTGCAQTQSGAATAPLNPPIAVPSPSSPAAPTYPVGRSAPADNGQVSATVFEYRQPAAAGAPGGTVWGAADVQVCILRTALFDVTVSRAPWQLLTAGGRTIAAWPTAEPGLPQPAYPTDYRRLAPGECVRGWIGFLVPNGQHPVAAQYAPPGAQPVTWPTS